MPQCGASFRKLPASTASNPTRMAEPKTYDYLQADFLADLLSLGRGLPAPVLPTDLRQAIEARFLEQYPDPKEARWKMLRCCAAHSYFVRNMMHSTEQEWQVTPFGMRRRRAYLITPHRAPSIELQTSCRKTAPAEQQWGRTLPKREPRQ